MPPPLLRAALPWYRFRDDGLLLWDAIRGYVEEYVDIYYHWCGVGTSPRKACRCLRSSSSDVSQTAGRIA